VEFLERARALAKKSDPQFDVQTMQARGLDKQPETQEAIRQILRDVFLSEAKKGLPAVLACTMCASSVTRSGAQCSASASNLRDRNVRRPRAHRTGHALSARHAYRDVGHCGGVGGFSADSILPNTKCSSASTIN